MNNEMQGCDINLHVHISKTLHERVNLIYQKRGLIATTRNESFAKIKMSQSRFLYYAPI